MIKFIHRVRHDPFTWSNVLSRFPLPPRLRSHTTKLVQTCAYIDRFPVKQPVLFCDRKFDEGPGENKRNTYLHTSQSSRNDKSPLHWLCFLALAFRKMCSFVPSSRALVTTVGRTCQGRRVIRAEENLCSTISGEKLPMNRWTRNDLVNDHDINHCFSSRYRSEDGCGLNWANCSLQETNQTDDSWIRILKFLKNWSLFLIKRFYCFVTNSILKKKKMEFRKL